MTDDAPVITVLNELLAAEQQSLAFRLFESAMFLSRLDVEAYDVVRSMADAAQDHGEALTKLILELGGEPAPRTGDVTTADLHFLELHYVLPRLISEQQRIQKACSVAASRLSTIPRCAAVIARVLDRHRQDLEKLTLLSARPRSHAS